jgi:hypothetical protein
MTHPVVPTFPSNPTIGQVFNPSHGGSWTFTTIGWVKTIIILTSDYPVYDGLLVKSI